jgi:GAF domain-containing protein
LAYVVERRKYDGTTRYLAQLRDAEGRIRSVGTHSSRRAAERAGNREEQRVLAGNWHDHTFGAIPFQAYVESDWLPSKHIEAVHGVRSSLSLPLRRDDTVYGSVNFYASTEYAFMGRERDLAVMFGASVQEAVANADLSMSSLGRARQAVTTLDERDTIQTAAGVLAARHGMTLHVAHESLMDAAYRAGVPAAALAELVLRQRVA